MRWLILIVLLSSCSAKWHMQLAKRHQLIAESKGAKIEKQVVYDTIEVKIAVQGDTTSKNVKAEIDTTDFFSDITRNDSLVLAITALHKELADGMSLDKEKTMTALSSANAEIKTLRKRIAQGYSKDSTYVVRADSLCVIKVRIKNGLLANIEHDRKATSVSKKEVIPILVRNIFNSGLTTLQITLIAVGGGILLLLIGFTVGYFARK